MSSSIKPFTGNPRTGWLSTSQAIKTRMTQDTARLLVDGPNRLVSPGLMPEPPANNASENVRRNYKNVLSAWKNKDDTWKEANKLGMSLLDKYVHSSVMEEYVNGQIDPGNFRQAWEKLDKQYGDANDDAVLSSMDSGAIYKFLFNTIKVATTFMTFWNLIVKNFHQFFNKNKTQAQKDAILDVEGKGTEAPLALNIVTTALTRSGQPWSDRLQRWESTHSQTRALDSLVAFMKREEAASADKKRGRSEEDVISPEEPAAKLLKTQANQIKQLRNQLNSLKNANKSSKSSSASSSGKTTTSAQSVTSSHQRVQNKHPQYKHGAYCTPDEACWNCGGEHHTKNCDKSDNCQYCFQNGYNPNCKKGWWRCAQRLEDKQKNNYKFLPPAACKVKSND